MTDPGLIILLDNREKMYIITTTIDYQAQVFNYCAAECNVFVIL